MPPCLVIFSPKVVEGRHMLRERFKVDSVKIEPLFPDLMQTLQVKWFVSKGQRLPIGHPTQRHQYSASRRLELLELTHLTSSHHKYRGIILWWEKKSDSPQTMSALATGSFLIHLEFNPNLNSHKLRTTRNTPRTALIYYPDDLSCESIPSVFSLLSP